MNDHRTGIPASQEQDEASNAERHVIVAILPLKRLLDVYILLCVQHTMALEMPLALLCCAYADLALI